MEYLVKSGKPGQDRAGCLIVGIFDRREASPSAQAVDRAAGGAIAEVMARGDFDGKAGQTLVLHGAGGLERILLVGLGKTADFDAAAFRRANAAAALALARTGAEDALSYLTRLPVKGSDAAALLRQAVLATEAERYRFDDMRGSKARAELPASRLTRLTFDVAKSDAAIGRALREAVAINAGIALTKNLGNLPGNVCTPTYLGEQALALGKQFPAIKVKVLDETAIARLGMGSFLSVSRGSRQPPRLIVMEYLRGKKGEAPVALVGKGLTFDAGGISIKPADKMDEMKFDMCGGASVLGTLRAVAEMKLPINLVGVVPATENLLSNQPNKPGDIVTSMAGITIEILNTDAEGRLILCDALTYVEKNYAPAVCIDIATLTGACVVALGSHATGLFSNTPALAEALLEAGEDTGDRAWRMPLWEDYQPMLKSEFADVANVSGGRDGGAITAACFLHRFTRKMKWAHLDVAGTAWKGKRATGRPVPLLTQYLMAYAGSKSAASRE